MLVVVAGLDLTLLTDSLVSASVPQHTDHHTLDSIMLSASLMSVPHSMSWKSFLVFPSRNTCVQLLLVFIYGEKFSTIYCSCAYMIGSHAAVRQTQGVARRGGFGQLRAAACVHGAGKTRAKLAPSLCVFAWFQLHAASRPGRYFQRQ